MHYIKQGQGCRIAAVLLTPTGEVSDLRRSRYISATLVLPSGATMPCRDLSFNEVTNVVCVRLLGTRELVKIGKYGIVFNVKLEDETMYSTPVVYFAEVKEDADAGYHELTLSLSIGAVNFPDNVSYTGASPQISDQNTWLVYDDNLNAYIDTGVETGYAHLLSRYDGQFAEITAAEEEHERAERQRESSEQNRVTSERSRIEAEAGRAREEKARLQAERSRVEAESGRVAAEQGREQGELSRKQAETLRANAEQGRVEAESERDKRVAESVAKADASSKRADDAAEAVMQLPVVRTDMSQEIGPEGQALARENISAVGALPVALTLAGDNTLTVGTPLDALSAHYKLYAARPGAYRWAMILSDASGGQVEETEAETIPADGVLHLVFRSQVLEQTYDLALTIAADGVTGASIAPWRRAEQAGANTTSGGYLATATDLSKYNGDRGLEIFFRTGADVKSQQYITSNNPLSLVIEGGRLCVSMWGSWRNDYKIAPNTDYHVTASFEKDKASASLYVNGEFISSSVREGSPLYSTYNTLGFTSAGEFPFKGIIYHARFFNFAPTAEDVAVFYNNGAPSGYIVPAEMRGSRNSYQSDFTAGVDGWSAANVDTTITWDSGLAASSASTNVRVRRTFTKAEAAFEVPRAYAFEVVVEGDLEFSVMRFYPFSSNFGAAVDKSSAEIIDGGLRVSGIFFKEGIDFIRTCYCYFSDVPIGTVVKIKSIKVTPFGCIAEYLPQNATVGRWFDSSPQVPVNGNLPPLWKSAGGYELTASGTPEVVYKSARRENPDLLAEVLAESECSLEARIARLEKALTALTTGRTFIPKLTVKELAVWGDNNLIVTGEGAPSKAPDRAGQIYIDTKNNAQYRSTGNAAVSDWKNA